VPSLQSTSLTHLDTHTHTQTRAMAGAGPSSRGGKGKGKAIELVGPRSGSFLPPDMPPREELDGHVPWIIQCDCGVECCYTANEAKIRNGGHGGSWGFVCGHTLSPAPYFVSFLSLCLFKLFCVIIFCLSLLF
jgi:hypothetical protein